MGEVGGVISAVGFRVYGYECDYPKKAQKRAERLFKAHGKIKWPCVTKGYSFSREFNAGEVYFIIHRNGCKCRIPKALAKSIGDHNTTIWDDLKEPYNVRWVWKKMHYYLCGNCKKNVCSVNAKATLCWSCHEADAPWED